MFIKSISLNSFRNYSMQTFDFCEGVNVICGENAQGKTNLLESVYMIATSRSFRTSSKKETIGFDKQSACILAEAVSRGRDFKLRAEISRISTSFFSINGLKCKRNAEMSDVLKAVLFRPEDLNLIKNGASERRKFIDTALCQLRPSYDEAVSRYNKLLESKQKILRDGAFKPSLYDAVECFSDEMAKYGAVIIKKRAEFCRLLNNEAIRLHSEISGVGEKLELSYKTVSFVDDPFDNIDRIYDRLSFGMREMRARETEARQCLCGPHRDDIDIFINGFPARSFGSQGQTRTAALSIKLAERQLFLKDTGEHPLLLLDDVLSELDAKRQDFVLNHIDGGQIFITCCEDEKLKNLNTGETFYIENGRLL